MRDNKITPHYFGCYDCVDKDRTFDAKLCNDISSGLYGLISCSARLLVSA